MNNEPAAIHIASRGTVIGVPMLRGTVTELTVLICAILQELLRVHPEAWHETYADLSDIFRRTEPKSRTALRWIRRIELGILIALAAFGLFSIGYFLKVRAFV